MSQSTLGGGAYTVYDWEEKEGYLGDTIFLLKPHQHID